MTIWFIADTHYSHYNCIKFCNRPFQNAWEMDREMTRRWNEVVKPDDIIYIIGDFVWRGGKGYKRHIINQLNGQKIFLLGNHDGKTSQPKSYLGLGFKGVYGHHATITIDGHEVLLCHYPYNPRLTKWQRFVYKLKHFWRFWRRDRYPFLKHMEKRPIDEGKWLLCGHVHNAWKVKNRMINVGVDVWNFYPVSEQQIIDLIKERETVLDKGIQTVL